MIVPGMRTIRFIWREPEDPVPGRLRGRARRIAIWAVLIFAMFMTPLAWNTAAERAAMAGWPKVAGEVTSNYLEPHRGRRGRISWHVHARYRYEVNGAERRDEERVSRGRVSLFAGERGAHAWADEHWPKGKRVWVRHHPYDPTRSTVDHLFSSQEVLLALMIVIAWFLSMRELLEASQWVLTRIGRDRTVADRAAIDAGAVVVRQYDARRCYVEVAQLGMASTGAVLGVTMIAWLVFGAVRFPVLVVFGACGLAVLVSVVRVIVVRARRHPSVIEIDARAQEVRVHLDEDGIPDAVVPIELISNVEGDGRGRPEVRIVRTDGSTVLVGSWQSASRTRAFGRWLASALSAAERAMPQS